MPMPQPLQAAIVDAVAARAHEDRPALDAAMECIADHGEAGMFAACGGWAEIIRTLAFDDGCQCGCGHPHCRPVPVGFLIQDGDGRILDPGQLPAEHQAQVWAFRFMAAIGNEDLDQAFALFRVATDDDDDNPLCYGPYELLSLAGQLYRSAGMPTPDEKGY